MSCPSPIALSETLAQCSIEPVTCLANGPACTDAPVNFGALIPFQELYFRDCNPTHTACPPNAVSQSDSQNEQSDSQNAICQSE